jgi:hypothetical protein
MKCYKRYAWRIRRTVGIAIVVQGVLSAGGLGGSRSSMMQRLA